MTNNLQQFKIHGSERRKIKKELFELKSFLQKFWYYHQLDKDMASFYGGAEGYPMSDDKAQIIFDNTKIKIKEIEELLLVKY